MFEDKRAFDWSEEFNGLKEVCNLSNFRILAKFKCKERWGRNWWIQFVKTGQVDGKIKNKSGDGVCVYMRKTLKSKALKDLSGILDTGFHQLWMQVQLKTLKSFLLCGTYKPPDCDIAFFEGFRDRYT